MQGGGDIIIDMKNPIVKVITKDEYELHGLLLEHNKPTENIIIHIHGSAGDFYQNEFYPYLFKMADELGYSFLSTNNRGTGVYNLESGYNSTGAAIELFEECIFDLDAWIEFALALGYKNIILEGHSFGTNKIQYYLQCGKYKDVIKAIILLGFTDSYGGQIEFLKKNNIRNKDVLEEAKVLIDQGLQLQLLSNPKINWGELPQSAQSYISFMSSGSNLSKILPLQSNQLENFRKIMIPILGIVGDHNECTVIDPKAAVDFLNRENKNAKCYSIDDCDHSYTGKEQKLVSIIGGFLRELSLE